MRLITSLEGCMMSAEEVIQTCESNPLEGLNDVNVVKRREDFGKNEFLEDEDEPLYMKILDKVTFLVVLLIYY